MNKIIAIFNILRGRAVVYRATIHGELHITGPSAVLESLVRSGKA